MSTLTWLGALLLIATAACTKTAPEEATAPAASFSEEFTPPEIPTPVVDWVRWQPERTGRFKIYAPERTMDTTELDRLLRVVQELDRLTSRNEAARITIRAYPNLVALGQATEAMGPVHFDDQATVHVCPAALPGEQLWLAPELWAAVLLDQPTSLDYSERMATVAASQLTVSLSTELYQHIAHRRWLGQQLAKTAIADHLPPSAARSSLIEYYRAMARVPGEVVTSKAGLASGSTKSSPGGKGGPRLKGMTFAHEGYRVYNGYGGSTVDQSLTSLAQLNVNALAVVPYTFQRNARVPNHLSIPYSAGGENDAATTYSLRQAKQRGWFTLLKPQIWVGGGSWPGDVDFDDPTKWDAWFKAYEYWILHYALLAEREGVDALCIGTELVRTTLTHPDRWRRLIADLRLVYSGRLTYAANWGEEFENLSFWGELDVMGLNSYYPISKSQEPTDGELEAGVREWLAMAAAKSRTVDKPLWLTEVGFRSVERTWLNPHAEAGERAADNVAQSRAYRALFAAAQDRPELTGMFIWKWPSYLGYDFGRRMEGKGFTPQGKPAAATLGKFYLGWD